MEFSHRNALQQGLKLHQTELDGRKINVELTAGGGGKSEHRLEKVKKRNRELHEQRVFSPHVSLRHALLSSVAEAAGVKTATWEEEGGRRGRRRRGAARTPTTLFRHLRSRTGPAEAANMVCSGGRRRSVGSKEGQQEGKETAAKRLRHRCQRYSCRLRVRRSVLTWVSRACWIAEGSGNRMLYILDVHTPIT